MAESEVEEQLAPSPSTELDWGRLFKMAEDPDIEDIMRGPIETAINHLQEGKEVQKLQAIRSLPDLLDSEGEETIQRLLPVIQQTLKEEKSNLDIHCEAAVVFKGVLQNDSLCARFPGLIDTFLENILQNVAAQKDNLGENHVRLQIGPVPQVHHLSAAAWLETLVEVADRVSLDAVKQYIVPVVQQQAEPVQRVQRRIIATKLLHKLADILPSQEVRKELGPCAQMLCQDANSNVRTAMAQRLPVIARALKNPSDTVSLLLPCFVQLCKDDDLSVREACMNNLAQCLPHFTNEAKKSTIFPLIRKTTEMCLEKKDDTLMVVARHLGEWTFTMIEILDQLDMSWVLNTYIKIAALSQSTGSTVPAQSMLTMCRRMSAYNFPCMVELYPKAFDRLAPIFEAFCTDSDDEVRLSMAASFHEILCRQSDRPAMLTPFVELIRGGAPEVVSKITRHLDKVLPILYKLAAIPGGKVSVTQLDRMLIGCNQLLRGTGQWRGHEALLRHMAVLRSVLPYRQLMDTFIPVLQKETLLVRAIPCRIAAVTTLLLFMREQPEKEKREEVIAFFRKEILVHPCCYRRGLFLDVVECVIRLFSRRFFIEYFLEDTVKLTQDPVSNIRLKAIRLLPRVKAFFILPEDDVILLEMEKAVGTALGKEKHKETRGLLQAAACDLSRCESRLRGDTEDAKKVEEEDRLWSEERIRETENKATPTSGERKEDDDRNTRPSGLRPPEPTRAVSPWRSQRRAIAVVRPQPIVVMRSASPAPSCISDGGRPSRLPLSIREKELLKRTTVDSAMPRPSIRSSSLSSRNVMSTSASSSFSSESRSSPPSRDYGLRRSATTTTGFGSISTSSSSYPLMTSRSTTSLRRPSYGLTKVSSQSTLERKPPQMRVKIRGIDIK